MNECIDRQRDSEWVNKLTDEWTDEQIERQAERQMVGLITEGWMYWQKRQTNG